MKKLCLLLIQLCWLAAIHAQSNSVVISQVYGGGGSTTGTYNSDYVELHNISNVSQDISGFKIMYGSSSGSLAVVSTNAFVFPAGTTIQAGGYVLVANVPGTGLSPLPITADYTFTLGLSGSNGKVAFGTSAMINNTTFTAQPAGAVIDFVGYGTANESEGSAVAALSATTAAIRKNSGCTETNNNSTDFTVGTLAPRNSLSPVFLCSSTPCHSTSSTTNLNIPSTQLPYSWNGLTFNNAGTQTATLTDAAGCDSLATLNLTVINETPAYLPANGLVGWWPFNGNANDESGNGNNGTVNGATLTTDRFGNTSKSYRFDGLSNHISSTPIGLPVGSQPRTVSSWFKTTAVAIPTNQYPNIQMINGYGDGNTGPIIFPQNIIAPQGLAWFETGSSNNNVYSLNPVNDGVWHNFTTTYSGPGTPVKVYIDGVLQGSTSALTINTFQSNFIIGGCPWATIFFRGDIDDIAIYNRALTQQEIAALYSGCTTTDSSSFSASGCNVYTLPWGDTITASGAYTHTYTNANGCDSIVTANITINNHEVGASVNVSGTASYALPWGDTARNSGYYTHVYQNQNGCDSLVTYYVVVNQPSSTTQPNVGINVQNPQRALHVNDAIRLEPRNTPLENPTKGDMYFDGTTDKLRIYDGRAWRDAY